MTGSVPTGSLQNGEVWTLAQWTAAWQSKADDAYTAPFIGAVATTVPKKLAQSISVLDFGADPTGVADSTAAINAALLAGPVIRIPAGTYKVTNALILQFANQLIYGDDMNTVISAASTFNLSAAGVFVAAAIGSPDHGPWFVNLRITCDQSQVATTGTRANLRLYPPALFLRGSPRWHVIDCRIDQFTFGIDGQGPTPGGVIDGLEIGCYSCSLAVDGSGDTTRIEDMHVISFNEWTTNQRNIMADGNTVGIASGRCDGLNILDSLFYSCHKGVQTFLGNGNNQVSDPVTGQALAGNGGSAWLTGFTTGMLTQCGFDTFGGLYQSGLGTWLIVANSYFSAGAAGPSFVTLTDGTLHLDNCHINVSGGPPSPCMSISSASAQPVHFSLRGGEWQSNFDQTILQISGSNAVDAIVSDVSVVLAANLTNANPIINNTNTNTAGYGLTVHGCRLTPKGTGTGSFITIATDSGHHVNDNEFNGWSLSMPANYTKASVSNNTPRGTLGLNASNTQYLSANSGASTVPAASTVYLGPGGYQAGGPNANIWVAQAAGNITGFSIKANVTASTTFTYTVYHNGVASSMTGAITGANSTLSVATNPFAVAAGDSVTLQLVTAAAANVGNHAAVIALEPA